MKTFLFLIAIVAGDSVAAQQSKSISSFHYRAENTVYYEVKNGVPNSDIAFYSERHGGKLLKAEKLNESGSFSIVANEEFKPAFVLNSPEENEQGVKGSGKVYFMEAREFTIRDIKPGPADKIVSFAWTASTDPAKNISFEVLKSYDGVSWTTVADINAYKNDLESEYSFTEHSEVAGSFYKVKVNNSAEGNRYTSQPFAMNRQNEVKVYPTNANSKITIEIAGETQTEYAVANTIGQVVMSGILSKGANEIQIQNLPAGLYIVNVISGANSYSEKIVKE